MIKLKTLGAKWFLLNAQADLETTENMMALVSKTIFEHTYMSHKE